MSPVRTRFAPSPTGSVHIGNIRTAIYTWLFARHTGGTFLLRIEDTDRERSTPEAVHTVLDALGWLGLNYDEAPLYQSQRLARHLEMAERLLASGHAYKEEKGGAGKGSVVQFKMPGRDMAFRDQVKGDLAKAAAHLTDFVIVRSNGTPVFHLANVVDDIDMGITHVIRGDDHVENTFRHIALFEALGAPPPTYAHLPMIVNAQGKPYSKRDGDAFVGDFRAKGFLPEALFNYLVLLGWSPGDDREVMTRAEIVQAFDFSRVRSAPSQMDINKLLWMNGVYLQKLPEADFDQGCRAVLESAGLLAANVPEPYVKSVLALLRTRLRNIAEVADQAVYFFKDDYPVDEKAARKRLGNPEGRAALEDMRARFAALPEFTAAALEAALRQRAEELGANAAQFIHPVRVAVSGTGAGPGLFEMLAVLGRERVLARMDRVLQSPLPPP